MTKSEAAAVARACQVAKVYPDIAARSLATLHRSARTRLSRQQIHAVLDRECLFQYLVLVNGELVGRGCA